MTNRPHSSGARICTEDSPVENSPVEDSPAVCGLNSVSANGTPWRAARSLATPITLSVSGRFGSASNSKTTSSRSSSASVMGRPRARSGGRIRMPSWSSPISISRPEHNMPLLAWPRILRGAMSMPEGISVPIVARGTRSPTAILVAPQQICRASPSPRSTSTKQILSASG
ncbi:unannotated protein [freshwater metagenome]|uniref:Unannotated protein n=1 Tax=freshwater metagenome TaxID=449393 RepID=A0A6J7UQP8_9ZZZZ